MEQAEALKAKGVQVVACLSINDVFVTEEWGRAHQAEGKVRCEACEGSGQVGGFLVFYSILFSHFVCGVGTRAIVHR